MITITAKVIHPHYSNVDRIKILADTIRVLEESAYNLPVSDHGTPILRVQHDADQFGPETSKVTAEIPGAFFNSHVSPYWFECLDREIGELDRIWTATFETTIEEGN